MSDCCHGDSEELQNLAKRQSKVLWIVLSINISMFFVEMTAGILSDSLALVGDSLDMLGDSLAYGSTLYVLQSSFRAKIRATQFKALLMFLTGAFVLYRAVEKLLTLNAPKTEIMLPIAVLVLFANLACLLLLSRHREDDLNFKSVWICSRNDIVANVSVLAAAGLVYTTASPWPDIVVGLGITALFFKSSFSIFKETLELSEES